VTAITANKPTICSVQKWEQQLMNTILTYNPVLIDERNEQPLLIAFVAAIAVWAVVLLIAVVGRIDQLGGSCGGSEGVSQSWLCQ
jgi:hypothetical protein